MEHYFSEFVFVGPERPAHFHSRSGSDLVKYFQVLESKNPGVETYIRILPPDESSLSALSGDDLFERRASILSKLAMSTAGYREGIHRLQCMIVGPEKTVDDLTETVKQALHTMMQNWKLHVYEHLTEVEW